MNKSAEHQSYNGDDASLVDLAVTFIRRRRVFYVVFVLVTLGGLSYALLAAERYRYTSLLQVAERATGEYIEKPSTTIATLETRLLPEQKAALRTENNKKLPFEVAFSNPDGTGLIRFESEASKEYEAVVEKLHRSLIDQIRARQKLLVDREQVSLNNQIDSTKRSVEALQGRQEASSALADAYERKAELESDLESIKGPEVLVVGRQSEEKAGPARVLVLLLTLFLAGVLGIVATFLAEFAGLVRAALGAGVSLNGKVEDNNS